MSAIYSTSALANLLLITERHLMRLVAKGAIPQAERGKYELDPAVQAYIRHLRSRDHLGEGPDDPRVDWQRARARRARIEADQLEGKSLDRDEVERSWLTLILSARARFLSIPSQLAPQVYAAISVKEVADLLDRAIAEALDELSYQPVEAAAGVEGESGDATGDAGRDRRLEAADEEDDLAVG